MGVTPCWPPSMPRPTRKSSWRGSLPRAILAPMLAPRCTIAVTHRALPRLAPSRPETASGGLGTIPRLRLSRCALQPTDASGKNRPHHDRPRRCSHLPQSKLHKYTINLLSPCSAKSVFDYFKGAGHSAPGAPAASEGTHNLTLTGNNPIRQDVNSATGTIVNTTLPGHQFYPGTVTIQVTPLGRETSTITVTGEGTGAHPILNDVVGQAWFGGTANGASDACGRW
jgi:hypothetical protein